MFTIITNINGVAKLIGGPLMALLVLIKRNGEVILEGFCFFLLGVSHQIKNYMYC
jgi:hypothetical protein